MEKIFKPILVGRRTDKYKTLTCRLFANSNAVHCLSNSSSLRNKKSQLFVPADSTHKKSYYREIISC